MILLISSLAKVLDCARTLQDAVNEPVTVCTSAAQAVTILQAQECSAVIFDQLLLDSDPDEGHTVLKHLGSAVPVYINFAVSNSPRVERVLRLALQRRKRELAAAKTEAAQTLRNELNSTVTALLLSCEMALQVPDLPAVASSKLHDVEDLVRQMSTRLGATA